MTETKETTKRSGKVGNGVSYEREVTIYTREDGRKLRTTVTDYSKDGRTYRVIEHSGYCSVGRENAEMFQIAPVVGKTRTYKHPENARAKAIELALGANPYAVSVP